ncbi:MAG: hypothetical protein AAGE01_02420 [Pseudomonadota bacterium]
MGASVVIVQHRRDTDFLLHTMALEWRRRGIETRLHVGPHGIPEADALILHVDLTVVPGPFRAAIAERPLVINGNAIDIRRRGYSTQLLDDGSCWDGPVIVKSAGNYGGIPEEMDRRERGERVDRGGGWATTRFVDPRRYPVFPAIDQVPREIWGNRHLVVERFLPEREGGLYFVRYWLFFGDRSMTGRLGSRRHIVKFSTMVCDTGPCEPPPELVELRERLGLDYGRFDYVVHDGRTFVFDANRTMGGGPVLGRHIDAYHHVGRGIEGYLSGRVRPLGA